VDARWQAVHGGIPGEADIDALCAETEPMMDVLVPAARAEGYRPDAGGC
jgi:hypothetical protein